MRTVTIQSSGEIPMVRKDEMPDEAEQAKQKTPGEQDEDKQPEQSEQDQQPQEADKARLQRLIFDKVQPNYFDR